MYSIKHLFHINAPRQKVFEALSSIDGLSKWWTTKTTGGSGIGEVVQFRFGEMGGPDMKITEAKPGEKVSWECIASPHGWVGHILTFALDENDGKTRVCSFSWGRYMESLRQLCQTGTGEAFGSEGFRK
jgi:uncharacterized protein YndB with AHSA1/START domain